MNKFFTFILIIAISPLLGAVYGIIHDQITYSLSEEYYTKFKFAQFRLDRQGMGENLGTPQAPNVVLENPRKGAAIVGMRATWWVGLIIGMGLGLVGLIHADTKRMFRITVKAIMITIGVALLMGLIGWLYGWLFLADDPPNWFIPENVLDTSAFIAVGSMHNFSYLGGLFGLILGAGYSVWNRGRGDAVNE